jgi:hypothetical protein
VGEVSVVVDNGTAPSSVKELPPQVAAHKAALRARREAGLVDRTAIVPVTLSRKDHLTAHAGCHAAANVWNTCVGRMSAQWKAGKSPTKEDFRRHVTSLPADQRPFHAHTAQAVAYDLYDAVATMRANKRAGRKARAPWREKQYRPLSFSKRFGWTISPDGRLALSLGQGRDRILLPVPDVASREGARGSGALGRDPAVLECHRAPLGVARRLAHARERAARADRRRARCRDRGG